MDNASKCIFDSAELYPNEPVLPSADLGRRAGAISIQEFSASTQTKGDRPSGKENSGNESNWGS